MPAMDIIVFGSGGHAESAIDVIEEQGVYTIVGLIDDTRQTMRKREATRLSATRET